MNIGIAGFGRTGGGLARRDVRDGAQVTRCDPDDHTGARACVGDCASSTG